MDIFEYEGIVPESSDDAKHYGTPRHSGRYPWGSGKNPQRSKNFYRRVEELRAQYRAAGMKAAEAETLIAKGLGMSTTDYRKRLSNARAEERQRRESIVRKLYEENPDISRMEISRITGFPESTVRSLLNEARAARTKLNQETAEQLKAFVDANKYIDIGAGSELALGVTANRLANAAALLKEQGYQEGKVWVEQLGTNGQRTSLKVLYGPDVDYQEVYENRFNIKSLEQTNRIQTPDGTYEPAPMDITPIDMSRVYIRYPSEGGAERDGTIELRRGVEDLDLGKARYAQCRIAVDEEGNGEGKYYLKGVAVYRDDIPPGYDIVFNTSKPDGAPPEKVFKALKTEDPSNPFGATIKGEDELSKLGMVQKYYKDPKTGEYKVSPINVVNEEGTWQTWSKNLPSQMLSKQQAPLIKNQLGLAAAEKRQEFAEICALTNPTVKKKMLETFSEECDAAAVDLKAAALPGQSVKLILPVTTLKDNEVYAPTYKNGERLALIRYPHQGIFEIPIVTVNNKNKEAKAMMENAPDAIGINSKVASRLSGADFDGDTVTAIPVNDRVKIQSSKPLKELEGFDPRAAYPGYEGMTKVGPKTDGFRKGMQMGMATNLVSDMSIKGAPLDEVARAVKYAQVVIDAEKHQLDWKRCYEEQGIADLKRKWQDNGDGKVGASTIISRAKSPEDVPLRKARTGISALNTDPETGKKIVRLEDESKRFYEETKPVRAKDANGKYMKDANGDYVYETYVDKNGATKIKKEPTGKILERTQESTKMAEADDAYKLTSGGSKKNPGYLKEALYAEYANTMKDLGNRARKEYLATPNLKRDPEAAKEYAAEVESLNAKLTEALKNAPRERQAQLLGNQIYNARKQANPDKEGDKEWASKAKSQSLAVARAQVGAKKQPVNITDREWEAIQKGAISESKLRTILNNTKSEDIKRLATPRESKTVSNAKQGTAKSMYAAGYTLKEIADKLGVSTSTISGIVNE